MLSELTLIATVVAKSETVSAVREELGRLVEPTRQEPGCSEYHLHQDKADPATFVFYERWESEEHLETHINSDHFRNCSKNLEGMVKEKSLIKLTCIA